MRFNIPMNIRKAVLTVVPVLAALANVCGNIAFMRTLIACADSFTPCTPSNDQIVLSSILAFPISLLPISLGYLGFVINAALWAGAAYVVLRLVPGRAEAA